MSSLQSPLLHNRNSDTVERKLTGLTLLNLNITACFLVALGFIITPIWSAHYTRLSYDFTLTINYQQICFTDEIKNELCVSLSRECEVGFPPLNLYLFKIESCQLVHNAQTIFFTVSIIQLIWTVFLMTITGFWSFCAYNTIFCLRNLYLIEIFKSVIGVALTCTIFGILSNLPGQRYVDTHHIGGHTIILILFTIFQSSILFWSIYKSYVLSERIKTRFNNRFNSLED